MSDPRLAVHASGPRRPVRRRPVRRVAGRRPSSGRRSSGSRGRRSTPRNAGNWWTLVLVVLGVLVALAWTTDDDQPLAAAPTCALPGSARTITPEQAENAAIIAKVGWDRGLPDRAVVIALATAQQESGLRNLDYGDRDSLGLFQQRPSMNWGTPAQVQDPEYAAGQFYDRLIGVQNWNTRPLAEASDAVQRSAYPNATAKHEAMAIDLTAALRAGGGELDCH
jgi:hypothetical protein